MPSGVCSADISSISSIKQELEMATPSFHLGQLCNNRFAALSESVRLGSVSGIFWQLKLKLSGQELC
jgi:hypothetical protein